MDVHRLFDHGNSTVVTVPKAMLSKLGWQTGDEIEIRLEPEEEGLFLTKETGLHEAKNGEGLIQGAHESLHEAGLPELHPPKELVGVLASLLGFPPFVLFLRLIKKVLRIK